MIPLNKAENEICVKSPLSGAQAQGWNLTTHIEIQRI